MSNPEPRIDAPGSPCPRVATQPGVEAHATGVATKPCPGERGRPGGSRTPAWARSRRGAGARRTQWKSRKSLKFSGISGDPLDVHQRPGLGPSCCWSSTLMSPGGLDLPSLRSRFSPWKASSKGVEQRHPSVTPALDSSDGRSLPGRIATRSGLTREISRKLQGRRDQEGATLIGKCGLVADERARSVRRLPAAPKRRPRRVRRRAFPAQTAGIARLPGDGPLASAVKARWGTIPAISQGDRQVRPEQEFRVARHPPLEGGFRVVVAGGNLVEDRARRGISAGVAGPSQAKGQVNILVIRAETEGRTPPPCAGPTPR